MTKRFRWIDWMKVLGMYAIVWGHFFSTGYVYLYVFSVPVFFVISGFLSKIEENSKLFWHKMFNTLCIPIILISSINFLMHTTNSAFHGKFIFDEILSFPFLIVGGSWRALGGMWFVYTLLVLKILLQFTPKKNFYYFLCFLGLTGILGYLYIHHYRIGVFNFIEQPNAILNICTAYPFFMIGYILQKYTTQLNSCTFGFTRTIFYSMIAGGGIVVCALYNTPVWMYKNEFGNNFLLFLVGGFSGTNLIYLMAKQLNFVNSRYIELVARGCIIILGFQMIFIRTVVKIFPVRSLWDALFAMGIMLVFIPMISVISKHFPWLMGKR